MSGSVLDGHVWIGAATVVLPPSLVRQADQRGTIRLRADKRGGVKVTVLEVYCQRCRRGFEVDGKQCEAAENREHLIGGPLNTRKKREDPDDDLTAVAAN